jgi:hypothetical protein
MQLRTSQLSASVLISVHEQCYVCKIIQEQSLQCSSSVKMWVREMWVREMLQLTLTSMSEQFVRFPKTVEEGGMSIDLLAFPLTVIDQSLQT